MTALIATLASLAYAAVALYAARWLYGHWRARTIDHDHEERYGYTTERAVESWNDIERAPAMATAVLCGTFWPATAVIGLLGILLVRFLSSTPVLSQAEHKEQQRQRERRIAELEAENERLRRTVGGQP